MGHERLCILAYEPIQDAHQVSSQRVVLARIRQYLVEEFLEGFLLQRIFLLAAER